MAHRRISGDNAFHDDVLVTIGGDIREWEGEKEKESVVRKYRSIDDACVFPIDGSSSRETQVSFMFLRARSIREASCYLVFAA